MSYAQKPGREKLLLVGNSDISGYIIDGLHTTTTVDPDSPGATTVVLPAFMLLKDLGRQIVVYQDPRLRRGSPHLAIYRQVLPLDGSQDEGVGTRKPCYVLVYSADPSKIVGVSRTG
jgi:hypothetical protein